MSNHSPTPWRTEAVITDEPTPANYDMWAATTWNTETGKATARLLIPTEWANSEDNIRWIVACVNFCGDGDPEKLTALGTLDKAMEAQYRLGQKHMIEAEKEATEFTFGSAERARAIARFCDGYTIEQLAALGSLETVIQKHKLFVEGQR